MKSNERHIIVPSCLNNSLFFQLMQKEGKNSIFGLSIDSFDRLAAEQDPSSISETAAFSMVYQALNLNGDSFPSLKEVLRFPQFVQPIWQFYKEMVRCGITPDDLPCADDQEKEIIGIIRIIDGLEPRFGLKNSAAFLKMLDPKDFEISNDLPGNYYETAMAESWIAKGAKLYPLYTPAENPEILFRKSSTANREVSAAARYIVERQEEFAPDEIQVLVPQGGKYPWLIRKFFKAYNIPYTMPDFSFPCVPVMKLLSALEYLKNPCKELFYDLLRKNTLRIPAAEAAEYMEFFLLEPDSINNSFEIAAEYDRHMPPFDYSPIDERDIKLLLSLEEKAEAQRQALCENELLQRIIHEKVSGDLILAIFNHVSEDPLVYDSSVFEHFSVMNRIRSAFTDLYETNAPLELYLDTLYHAGAKMTRPSVRSVLVTDLAHIQPGKKLTIVLDASQEDLIPDVAKTGLIREGYLSRVKGYPALEDRLEHEKKRVAVLRGISPSLVISYSYSDLQGNPAQLSVYIEEAFHIKANEITPWADDEEDRRPFKEAEALNEQEVRALYTRGSNIPTSISALEKLPNCPYAFFLNRGLRIRENRGYITPDQRVTGTIRHKAAEKLLKDDKGFDRQDMETVLEEEFRRLRTLYPNQKTELDLMQKVLADHLYYRLYQLMEIQRRSPFEDYRNEEHLDGSIPAKPMPFSMTAIADRIEMDDESFRILDYKSSKRSFSPDKFKEGKQLQLMTYLYLAAQKRAGQAITGAYYFNFSTTASSKTKPFSLTESKDILSAYYSNNKLTGYTFSDTPEEYFDKEMMQGTKKAMASSELNAAVEEVYQKISDLLWSGSLAITPSDYACCFCQYQPVCRKKETKEEEEEGSTDETDR